MKKVSVATFTKNPTELLDIAQHERVVVTRNGRPLAVLVGIENKDQEDLALERDESFWRMIRSRRKEKTVPLRKVKECLGLNEQRAGKSRDE